MFIIFMMPSGSPKTVRVGQADRMKVIESKPSLIDPSKDAMYQQDKTEAINEELAAVNGRIEEAKQEELVLKEEGLNSAIKIVGFFFEGIIRRFAKDRDVAMTDEEVDDVVDQVKTYLRSQTVTSLESAANVIALGKEEDIQERAFDESKNGVSMATILSEMQKKEELAIADVKRKIDQKADEIQDMLKQKAEAILLEILEERLGKKLGKTVRLVIVDNVIERDGLFDGLNNIVREDGGRKGSDTRKESQRIRHKSDDGGFDDDAA